MIMVLDAVAPLTDDEVGGLAAGYFRYVGGTISAKFSIEET